MSFFQVYLSWCFETDLIEVVRDYSSDAKKVLEGYQRKDFMEIYLFFDYDGHQDHLTQIDLYKSQKEKFISQNVIAVINSFPLFLLEYFKSQFWEKMLT